MTQELIDELKEKQFVDNNSLVELDKLLESIIASIKENYTSEQETGIKFITSQLEGCRTEEVNHLKQEGVSDEAEIFNTRGMSALGVLETFDVLVVTGDIVRRDSGQ